MLRTALLGFALIAGACANFPADNPPETPSDAAPAVSSPVPAPVVGGYSPADAANPDVAAAEKLAIDEIYRREPQRSLVESVTREQQVVAGMNYRFIVKMSGVNSYAWSSTSRCRAGWRFPASRSCREASQPSSHGRQPRGRAHRFRRTP